MTAEVMTIEKTDPWWWWLAALSGQSDLPNSEGTLHFGFWRHIDRSGTHLPAATWQDETGAWLIKIGDRVYDEAMAHRVWPWLCTRPISHALYEAIASGKSWPDQHEAVTALSNNPPVDGSFEDLRDAIDELAREASKLAKAGAATTQAEADRASDLATKLSEFEGKADSARREEKKPHDEASKAVQAKWTPIITKASIGKETLKSNVIAPFLRDKRDAERKAMVSASQNGTPLPEKTSTKAGTRGVVALRTHRSAKIVDYAATLQHFAQHEDVKALVQKLANAAIRSKLTVPGVEVIEDQKAA